MKAIAVVVVLFVGASGLSVAGGPSPKFKITRKRKDDVVEVQVEDARTVFAVKSPFGISQMVVEREDDSWPRTVVLRLHLKGLENFRVTNGKLALNAAVSIQDGKPKVRQWENGKEDAPLDGKSPFWMDIRILSGEGKPARKLPLKDGYFEMTLPKAFLKSNPKSLTINWIDFYR